MSVEHGRQLLAATRERMKTSSTVVTVGRPLTRRRPPVLSPPCTRRISYSSTPALAHLRLVLAPVHVATIVEGVGKVFGRRRVPKIDIWSGASCQPEIQHFNEYDCLLRILSGLCQLYTRALIPTSVDGGDRANARQALRLFSSAGKTGQSIQAVFFQSILSNLGFPKRLCRLRIISFCREALNHNASVTRQDIQSLGILLPAMGRYNLSPSIVRKHVSALLQTQRIAHPPPWYQAVSQNPPPQILVRQPLQRTQRPGKRSSRLFSPVKVGYEEDKLRWEYFNDHPWELARPRMVIEDDGRDRERWDWSVPLDVSLNPPRNWEGSREEQQRAQKHWESFCERQAGRPLNGES